MVANSRLRKHRHPRFEWLVNRGPQRGTLVYYVFDLLSLNGKDLRPLEKRKTKLARLLNNHPRLAYVDHVEGSGLAMFAGALALAWKASWPRTRKALTLKGRL